MGGSPRRGAGGSFRKAAVLAWPGDQRLSLTAGDYPDRVEAGNLYRGEEIIHFI